MLFPKVVSPSGRPDVKAVFYSGNHTSRPGPRIVLLIACFLLLLFCAFLLIVNAPPNDSQIRPFLYVWMLSFLPYFAGSALILCTKPLSGRMRWLEVGIILLGAFILRALLLPQPPELSHDSWRYLWDAQVTLRGYSPYVYVPSDKVFADLHNSILFANSRFRNVPTVYPPGAQFIYLLSYLLATSNLAFLKGIFLLFDMGTCFALVALLKRKDLDMRRVLLYAWCPLPIVEFAISGHVDVLTVAATLFAVLAAPSTSLRGRVLTGFLVGFAALTKIYPILLLVAFVPPLSGRSSFISGMLNSLKQYIPVLLTCFATIVLGYLPYLLLGHGQVFGFFASYANEQGLNAGIVQQVLHWLCFRLHLTPNQTLAFEHVGEFIFLLATLLIVFIQRLRSRISIEAATLLLFGAILSISSHVFPWYTTTLLVWVPVFIGPLKTGRVIHGKVIAILAIWYFACASIYSYFLAPDGIHPLPDWTPYYQFVYTPVVLVLALAAVIGLRNALRSTKGSNYVQPIPNSADR
ncbi:MAG TPA: glycosyltransferase family 87 protein [Ktedonobacteraceae bacterium]|jgi:hypothetical protein|nr:glycosyltransferase family 87 protein [Ktedonobacteraceae bacterium]